MSRASKSDAPAAPSAPAEPVPPGPSPAVEGETQAKAGPAFPVVAIGASAGGLEAMLDLVSGLPPTSGMAFVLIPHPAPQHESHLTEIVQRATSIPVELVTQGVRLAPDRIHMIPPDTSMELQGDALIPASKSDARGDPRSIDHLMRSVAETCTHRAIGVVLSGMGHDGTLGLVEIKGAGGITFAQDESARHTDMPRSAIASGAVDFVMSALDIARELGRISRHPYLDVPEADVQGPALFGVVQYLRDLTGVDFAHYRRNTLHRRITRRMVLRKLPDVGAYFDYLKANAAEAEALYGDVLIGVTGFFRDAESFEALKAGVFPKLAQNRGPREAIRAWSIGCSTGEEAYSLAMAFREFAEATGCRTPMQIFATDLSAAAVEKARAGLYAKGIAQDVSPERLARFFVEVDGSYRIGRPVRDMCVFARQNALIDPPFSNLDLVACRNLLIYLDPVLQQRLIPTLHCALRDPGWLWLGGSETLGSYRDLFEAVDVKHKIYEKKPGARRPVAFAVRPSSWAPPARPAQRASREPAAPGDPQREADRLVISRYAPPGVLIDGDFEILQFRGDTGPFLTPPPGRPSLNLLKMLREGLMVPVRGAVHRARREDIPIREEGLRLKSPGGWLEVDVVVLPLKGAGGSGTLLVLFEESAGSLGERVRHLEAQANAAQAAGPGREATPADPEVVRLGQELAATREYLQAVIEQQEAANEELQSANEEMQSANEELSTVNDELQARNDELVRSSSDFTNLLASLQVAILMLDADLRIRRFTPAAETLLELRSTDIGRRVGDVSFAVPLEGLEALALEVIDTMGTREREVRAAAGRWHLLRVRPYRTQDNRIEGVVVMLIDIDAIKGAEEALRQGDRAENGKIHLRTEPVDLCDVLRRSIAATAHERHAKDQALDTAVPDASVTVRGDPMRLDQVFSNLLNNAARFTPPGGRLRATLETVKEPDGAWAMVRISDNGIGIDPAMLPRVFELFVQGDRASSTTSASGIGLGLALARRLVELHGGFIEARSAGNSQGTELTVRLPLAASGD